MAEPLPATMPVVEISRPGGPEVLLPSTRPVPHPGPGQVLIRVAFAGVNRPDLLQRSGAYAPPPGASDLPGLECAGHVAAVGPGVAGITPGEAVCALLPGGGYAGFALTEAAHCLPVPRGMDLRAAACLPETHFTVWSNVFVRGGLRAGERFLVHGGASGIGTTAIQIAAARGARVWATAGSDDRARACEALGAERGINHRTEDFVAILKAEGGADVILDMVGGTYVQRNLTALADDGRLVQIAFLDGPKVELTLSQLMTRRLTMTGSTLRPQSAIAKARIADDLRAHVWPLLDSGRIAPRIEAEYPLALAAEAHARMEQSPPFGKIVLRVA